MGVQGIQIRKLTHLDWCCISKIYEEGLDTGIASFETGVPSWEDWNQAHDAQCRLVVSLNNQVVAYAALLPVSKRPQFNGVAEVRIYVAAGYRGIGVGSKLLKQLIRNSEVFGYWTLQVSIFKENVSALMLCKKMGFIEVGTRVKLAKRNDKWYDVEMLERRSVVVGVD
ncbi:GNAT family N-acetyltransferase [Aquimarina agarilytica]|uniref:GNAT family N-acetyltransferase n=1 Tax=Aquimarina agarilytica TaxID=1087449 RepID=UPI00028896E0|nr:GNAT family N-acetyltransferase [Aquimarina agarilytica]